VINNRYDFVLYFDVQDGIPTEILTLASPRIDAETGIDL
jgi:hypothetical protein